MLEDPIVKDQFLIGSDTVFDFGHRIFSSSDITCYVYNPDTKTETTLTSGTDFSVGLKPGTTDYSNGARVTLLTEQPAAGKLTVVRTVLPEQGVSLPNFGKIPSESLEAQLDRTIASVQQLHDTVQLAYKIPYGQSGTITPEQAIKNLISSGGGGGGGGGSSYEFSNEFNVTSGGSVSINKIDKEKITGLSSALDEKQDKLSSGGTYHINVDSAASAANAGYHGPFALVSSAGGSAGIYYGVDSGTLFIGGTTVHVDSSGGGSTPIPEGSTVYLHFFSSGIEYETEYTMNTTSAGASGHYYTRIGGNSGGKAVQYQYGDIRLEEPTSAVVSGMLAVDYENCSHVYMESKYTTGDATAEYPYQLGTGLGGIVIGTIRAPANPGANFDVSLVVKQGGPGTSFEVIHSGTSEVFVSVPFGPETKFHFGAFNGTPTADLWFCPYYLVNNN